MKAKTYLFHLGIITIALIFGTISAVFAHSYIAQDVGFTPIDSYDYIFEVYLGN